MKDYCIEIPAGNINDISKEMDYWLSDANSYLNMIEKTYQFAIHDGAIKVMANKPHETYKRAIELCR